LRAQEVEAAGELAISKMQLQVLEKIARLQSTAAAELPTQTVVVQSKEQMLEKIKSRQEQLTIFSGADGVVIEPPSKAMPKQAEAAEQLPTWTGNPFSEENRDAYFGEADLLCLVGDPNAMEAVVIIDQGDIDLVRDGNKVTMLLDCARLSTIQGKIDTKLISRAEMKESSSNLSIQSGGRLDTKMDESGRMRPISTSYQARIPIENSDFPLRSGYRGQARIHLPWKSIGWRLYRVIVKTFNFEF
jgi:putative peptide zinc metalloprotease protein